MTNKEVADRLSKLNSEMHGWNVIAMNFEEHQSDDVIRARKEIVRIKQDIADLLEKHVPSL